MEIFSRLKKRKLRAQKSACKSGLEIEVFVKNNCNKAYEELKKMALSLGIVESEILKKSLTYLAMKKLSKF